LVTEYHGSGTVVADHAYASAGVYTVMLTVTDDDTGLVSAPFQYIVIYDPDGGFVTGGGWLSTPQGSYFTDPAFTGKAHIGFNAKYQHGAPRPSGEMQLTLQGGQLTFHSEDYEWLVVAGSRAQLKGTGSVDGQGGYGFILTVLDGSGSGSQDMIRVKIWQSGSGEVVYDLQIGEADDADPTSSLGGGSIVIHSSH
jgi:hypothetical protein